MRDEKRHSTFDDWLTYSAPIDIANAIYVAPFVLALVVGVGGLGVYIVASHFVPGIIIVYFVLKILAFALAIAAVFYFIRRLVRRFGWGITVLVVALLLVVGVVFAERAAYRNYVMSMDETQRAEMSFIEKSYGFIVTKSTPARRAARKKERDTFHHDFRAVKSADARKLVAERYYAGRMFRDLDWITGNNLHLAENFLKETEYDIDELVKASEAEE